MINNNLIIRMLCNVKLSKNVYNKQLKLNWQKNFRNYLMNQMYLLYYLINKIY